MEHTCPTVWNQGRHRHRRNVGDGRRLRPPRRVRGRDRRDRRAGQGPRRGDRRRDRGRGRPRVLPADGRHRRGRGRPSRRLRGDRIRRPARGVQQRRRRRQPAQLRHHRRRLLAPHDRHQPDQRLLQPEARTPGDRRLGRRIDREQRLDGGRGGRRGHAGLRGRQARRGGPDPLRGARLGQGGRPRQRAGHRADRHTAVACRRPDVPRDRGPVPGADPRRTGGRRGGRGRLRRLPAQRREHFVNGAALAIDGGFSAQ